MSVSSSSWGLGRAAVCDCGTPWTFLFLFFFFLVTGLVAVGIRPSLPFKGVYLLLGNDLAGDKVVVNPLLTNIPCIDQPLDPIEQEICDLYPSCAVTRAMAKKAKQNDRDIDLTDTFLGQPFKHEITNSLSSSLSYRQTDLSDKSESRHNSSILNDLGLCHDLVSRSLLCKDQHNDPESLLLFERVFDEREADQVPAVSMSNMAF